jgi:hypothetical protein
MIDLFQMIFQIKIRWRLLLCYNIFKIIFHQINIIKIIRIDQLTRLDYKYKIRKYYVGKEQMTSSQFAVFRIRWKIIK